MCAFRATARMTLGQCKVEDKKSARQIFRKEFFVGCYKLKHLKYTNNQQSTTFPNL